LSRAVNKRLSVVGKFSVLIDDWLDFRSNTNHTKKENTFDLYYIKFHTHGFVYHRPHSICDNVYCKWSKRLQFREREL